jgi:predicted dithiol-disulfide oxidoreductase (DUF899 family)
VNWTAELLFCSAKILIIENQKTLKSSFFRTNFSKDKNAELLKHQNYLLLNFQLTTRKTNQIAAQKNSLPNFKVATKNYEFNFINFNLRQ